MFLAPTKARSYTLSVHNVDKLKDSGELLSKLMQKNGCRTNPMRFELNKNFYERIIA
jgi:hypothetical protein